VHDQKLGLGYPIFDFLHSGPHSKICRKIGHCNKLNRNSGLKLHKAPLLHICSLYAELYGLDQSEKKIAYFLLVAYIVETVITKYFFSIKRKVVAYTYHIRNQHAKLHQIGCLRIYNSTIGRPSYFGFVSDFASFLLWPAQVFEDTGLMHGLYFQFSPSSRKIHQDTSCLWYLYLLFTVH